jgi:hypothetical protein
MRTRTSLLVLGIILLAAPPAPAWNELGHLVVAKLAWEQLEARQQDAAYETLQQLPYFDRFMSERARPEGVSAKEWAFINASTWPDWLRDFTKTGKRYSAEISKFHVGPRHYINLSIAAPEFTGEVAKPKEGEENIVVGIRSSMEQLRDQQASPQQRALALAWLLHLVGDIHQPLHCGSYFSADYPQGDQGGNLRWIRTADGAKNLHAYWDDQLGSGGGFGRPPFDKIAADRMWDRVKEQYGLLRGAAYQRSAYAEALQRSDPMDWARDGNELARRCGYYFRDAAVPGHPILNYYQLPADKKAAESARAPELPGGYADASLDIARRQVALAGHRLADSVRAVVP